MSAQTVRWAMAFAATAAIAAAITASAASAPSAPLKEVVPTRDPAAVGSVELELILNKIREGDLLALKKDDAGARRAWSEARKAGEGLWPIHEGLGDSYRRAKLDELALREYTLAAERVPERFASSKLDLAVKRAETLAALGRTLDAVRIYLDLNQVGLFGTKIFELAMAGDRAAAVKLIEFHAEARDPRLFYLQAGLLRAMDRPGDAAEALAMLARNFEPWNETLNRQVIRDLRALKRTESAVEVARAWVRAVPEAVEGYEAMGDVYWDAGREREAVVAYSSIADVKPADAAARRRLGDIYVRRGRPVEAQAQFEAGLKLAPGDAELKARVVNDLRERLVRAQKAERAAEALDLRRRLGALRVQDVGLFDLKITMTWDSKSDVDLDVVEPDGTAINHMNRTSAQGGVYFTDNTAGYGPETYTLTSPRPGKYRVGAHLHSGSRSTATFVILLHEGTPNEQRREEVLVLESTGNSPVFVADLVIP